MLLNINDSQLIYAPQRKQVSDAIRLLQADEFAILGRDDQHYVQTYLNDDGTYQLEYRGGSEEQHYGADADEISVDDVCQAFETFFDDGDLQALLSWEKMDVGESEPGEGEVEYNGVVMDAEWPLQIEAAQEIRTVTLDGTPYPRIPFVAESNQPTAALPASDEVGVSREKISIPSGCGGSQDCPQCSQCSVSMRRFLLQRGQASWINGGWMAMIASKLPKPVSAATTTQWTRPRVLRPRRLTSQ